VSYAGDEFWDQFFRQRRESGDDLDWAGVWTRPFLVPLREAGVRTILELGCGTGNDAARLADEGYSVTAIDLSGEATSSPRPTCANSWQDGSRYSWSLSRSRIARRASRSSTSGAA
jgi:SAM-dependent methyltransferase